MYTATLGETISVSDRPTTKGGSKRERGFAARVVAEAMESP